MTASRTLTGLHPGQGRRQKLDKEKLPNWSHLDPEMLRILSTVDPGNENGMPYMWGSTGITYNTDLVEGQTRKTRPTTRWT